MPPRALALLLPAALAAVAPGCATRAGLHAIVLDYDETVSRVQAELLLLNVARARHGRPPHFTTVSGIAATFDRRLDAGLGAELSESPGPSLLLPSFGVSTAENPTLSIVPIQGEEFTRRLLAPLDEAKFAFFFHQEVEPELLLGMMAHGLVLEREGARRFCPNAGAPGEAGEFDRLVARLAALRRARALELGPLVFEESWALAGGAEPSPGELADLLERGYALGGGAQARTLSRRVAGRLALTSYDPATLTDAERRALHERAQQYPAYFVLVDLRAGDGGEALRGWIKLRSLGAVLDAIAGEVVRPDAPPAAPPRTLRVLESPEPPGPSLFALAYEGLHYSIPLDPGGRNPAAFRMLAALYQLAVSEIPGTPVPAITIAK